VPTVNYATTGSNTAASGAGGSAVTGTNGDISGTTITLNETAVLSDFAAGDVIWYEGDGGDRHLFEIVSFTGGAATCTAVVVVETATTTISDGRNWAVGGSRLDMDNDTSNRDWEDFTGGWDAVFGAGTFDLDAQVTPTGGSVTAGPIRFIGDGQGSTYLRSTTNTEHFDVSGGLVHLIDFTATTSATPATATALNQSNSNGSQGILVERVTVDGLNYGWYTNYHDITLFIGCIFENCTSHGVYLPHWTAARRRFVNCTFRNNGGDGAHHSNPNGSVYTLFMGCVFEGNTGDGLEVTISAFAVVDIVNCVFHDNGGHGLNFGTTSVIDSSVSFTNCIFTNNGLYGVTAPSSTHNGVTFSDYNAFYNNTSGPRQNVTAGAHDVTLGADPFTDAAGDDFSLNNEASGGGMLRFAGYGLS